MTTPPCRSASLLALLLATGGLGCGRASPGPPAGGTAADAALSVRASPQASGTDELLQAVSVVDPDTAWVSGHGGTWARTTDGGRTWHSGRVAGADTLQFRDVHAVDGRTAFLLSAGPGETSRIYRTDDAGESWRLQWTNPEPEGFWDCMDFWDGERGAAYGDAVGGALRILVTDDAGRSWRILPDDRVPTAAPGEGGFAASGQCLTTGAGGRGWVATGNADPARILRTTDAGATWSAVVAPLAGGEGAGLTAVAFRDTLHGIAVGGDLARPDEPLRNVMVSSDGGRTWRLAGGTAMTGAAYGVAWVPGTDPPTAVAVGPGGADVSTDGGATWIHLDDRAWWSVGFGETGVGWLVGPEGRILRLDGPGPAR